MFGKGVHDVPGPGKYELAQEVLNPEKGRTIYKAGREAQGSNEKSSSVHPRTRAVLQADTLEERSRSAHLGHQSKSPVGPGSYNISGQIGNPKKGVGFAKSTRYTKGSMFGPDDVDELDRIVGPGYYQIKSTVPQLQGWVKTGTKFPLVELT